MKKLCIIAALALVGCAVSAQQPQGQQRPRPAQGQQPPQGQQQQPRRNVFDPTNPGAHDPVMAKEGDTYYVFTTGNGVSLMTSKDLKTWTQAGSCIPQCPAWIQEKLPNFRGNNFWAPDIIYYQGKWHLFYAASAFGRNTSVIGHATSPTLNPESPDYKWTDQGCMIQSVPYRDMWNAIDANIVIDENGTPWMDFGSFWNGIMMVKLKDDLRGVATPEEWRNPCRRERSYGLDDASAGDGAVEAPFIYKHGDWYYLFVSFDACCRGLQSTYNIVVGRSKSAKGPYLDMDGKDLATGGGTCVMKGNGTDYVAVGHCAAYTIDGKDLLVTHAYQATDGASKLVVREIKWKDEWPVLEW